MEIGINELRPHPRNTEIYGNEETNVNLVGSIRDKGIMTPLLIAFDNRIISGHTRWYCAKEVGLASVPVVRFLSRDELDIEDALLQSNIQRKKSNWQEGQEVAATWRIEALRAKDRQRKSGGDRKSQEYQKSVPAKSPEPIKPEETREVVAKTYGLGQKKTGQLKEIHDHIIELKEDDKQEEAETLIKKLNKTSVNRTYNHIKRIRAIQEREAKQETSPKPEAQKEPTLILGRAENCPQIKDETIDIIITSPPYNLGNQSWPMGGNGRLPWASGIAYDSTKDQMSYAEYVQWQIDVFNEMYRVAKQGASFFYNHKPRTQKGVLIAPSSWVMLPDNPWIVRQRIIWDRTSTHNHSSTMFWPEHEVIFWMTKGSPTLPDKPIGMPDVWRIHGPTPNTWHPAPFSQEIPAKCLEAVGVAGAIVLDPFMGSGTTLNAAYERGYESIGIDISKDYIQKTKEYYRW